MKNVYLQVVGLILSLILVFGFFLPWLFSAESNIAVILGVVTLVVYIYGLLHYVPKIFINAKKLFDEKK